MNPSVGIDLGTTNTVVAVQTDATAPRLLEIPQPVDTRNSLEKKDHIKSAVLFESADSALVGALAAQNLLAFRSIKSKMGTRWWRPTLTRLRSIIRCGLCLRPYPGPGLSSGCQGVPRMGQDCDRHRARSFNSDQRDDTLLAAQLAGFGEVRLMDKPTAAFYFHFDERRKVAGSP